jgi:hypothetical protein
LKRLPLFRSAYEFCHLFGTEVVSRPGYGVGSDHICVFLHTSSQGLANVFFPTRIFHPHKKILLLSLRLVSAKFKQITSTISVPMIRCQYLPVFWCAWCSLLAYLAIL